MTKPSLPLAHELIRSACSAPSIHNTQPWSWRVQDADTIELYADRSRQLQATDPRGRDLAISCGAAVHHFAAAAEAFGVEAKVVLLPRREDKELLARIELSAGHTEDKAVDMLAALENRLTDRRGFSTWEVPTERLRHLCDVATPWGAHALALTDPWARHKAEELIEHARRLQATDPHIAEELRTWTDSLDLSPGAGIPTHNAAPAHRPGTTHRPSRFEAAVPSGPADSHQDDLEQEATDGLIAICTASDGLRSWLQAGQAMSAVWLQATLGGLAVIPTSQVTEVESTRRRLHRDLFSYAGRPQILLRIGWPEVARPPLPHTSRRSLHDVLRP
jgi:hypothetical protein